MTFPFSTRPLRDQVSFNKSDLIKYLIKKEEYTLKKSNVLLMPE